jgi:hypothetical protein
VSNGAYKRFHVWAGAKTKNEPDPTELGIQYVNKIILKSLI